MPCSSTSYWDTTLHSCQACPTGCASCSSSSNCLSCNANYELQSNLCQPCSPVTYYDAPTETCIACPNGCTGCSSSTSCSGCQLGYQILLGTGSGVCASLCPTGQFWDSSEGKCADCLDNCAACTGLNACTACVAPWSLNGGTCFCGDRNYMSPNARCTVCPAEYNCKACTGYQQSVRCLSCNANDNRYLTIFGSCNCKYGYVQTDKNSPKCVPLA